MLGEQVDSAVGQGIALGAPAVPTDIGGNVVSVEAYGFQDAKRFGEDLVTDAVAGHSHYSVFGHSSS